MNIYQTIISLQAYLRAKGLTPYAVRRFRELVRSYYREYGRDLPWRKTRDPYAVLVSEIMLQQTQVPRVAQKYPEFLKAFPDFKSLANAPVKRLLQVWQGMGYNRRALSLQKTAQAVLANYGGELPSALEELVKLPGIGPATAADILAFAFNKPAAVIETNIRAAYILLCFPDKVKVSDKALLPLVEKTMDRKNPRDWYNALMDLGAYIKKEFRNPARASAHYTRQSPFKGSNRELRSRILRLLLASPRLTIKQIAGKLETQKDRIESNAQKMKAEGMIKESKGVYYV